MYYTGRLEVFNENFLAVSSKNPKKSLPYFFHALLV